ncbi:M56 family metallopeptidase/LCP family protein [Inediibacterium massiliense]|uniref:M56 family metallopeptidase/LCP family protein n=1 Tax=Inediibacterium massiliense TaxID=1658111 RepID=UPI0006B6319E|nr:M56 family metallopeptidase/LCP family protein [Inediibacterium massiliense]
MLLQIFRAILITSAVGSVLAALLLLLKPITKRCFGSTWQYYAWAIVLIVMMWPVTIRLPQVATNIAPDVSLNMEQNFKDETVQAEFENVQQIPLPAVDTKSLEQSTVNVLKDISFGITDMICYGWLVGLMLIFGINLIRYLIFLRAIHKNSVIISCPGIDADKIITRKTSMIDAPLMVGIFSPLLLLPDIEMSEENLKYILLHELTHYRRHDLWYKWFAMLVNTVHWFNPFSYIISRQIDQECEISCDLSVVAHMDEKEQKNYMNTILTLASQTRTNTKLFTTAMASNKNDIKRRFTMIKNATKKSKIAIFCSVITACVILGTSIFASGVLSDKTQSQDLHKPLEIGNVTENQTNILLIGVDDDEQMRADTLMLLSLNKTNNSLAVLSIPRDTLITSDKQDNKISTLMTDGDAQKITDAVTNNLEIPVNYYVRINFEGFRNIVDILGGVEFNVPIDMLYDDPAQNLHISLEKGLQILDGEKAEQLVRYRTGYHEGDIARIRMQQNFITQLIKQKFDTKYLAEISGLYNELSKNVVTNYPSVKIAEDLKALNKININDIETFILPGTTELRQTTSYFVVNDTELKNLVEKKFNKID